MPEIDGGIWKEEILSMLNATARRTKNAADAEMVSSARTLVSSARCVSVGPVTGEGWDIPSGVAAAMDMDYNKPILSLFTLDGQSRAALSVNVSGTILAMSFTKSTESWMSDPAVLYISDNGLAVTSFFSSQADFVDERWISYGMSAAAIAGRTASILSCSNVHPSLIEPSAAIRRGRIAVGLDPKFPYETLGYTAFAESGKRAMVDFDEGRIKTYSKDKPLFGKYSGRFWLPAGARPSQAAGQHDIDKEQGYAPGPR